jgi:hypothetical protein
MVTFVLFRAGSGGGFVGLVGDFSEETHCGGVDLWKWGGVMFWLEVLLFVFASGSIEMSGCVFL